MELSTGYYIVHPRRRGLPLFIEQNLVFVLRKIWVNIPTLVGCCEFGTASSFAIFSFSCSKPLKITKHSIHQSHCIQFNYSSRSVCNMFLAFYFSYCFIGELFYCFIFEFSVFNSESMASNNNSSMWRISSKQLSQSFGLQHVPSVLFFFAFYFEILAIFLYSLFSMPLQASIHSSIWLIQHAAIQNHIQIKQSRITFKSSQEDNNITKQ